MSRLWDLVQAYIDTQTFPVSDRQIAKKLHVSPSTPANWRKGAMPSPENLRAIARLTGMGYTTALNAALRDQGYLDTEVGGNGGDTAAKTPAGDDPAEHGPDVPITKARARVLAPQSQPTGVGAQRSRPARKSGPS